jgi:hypothetical protein
VSILTTWRENRQRRQDEESRLIEQTIMRRQTCVEQAARQADTLIRQGATLHFENVLLMETRTSYNTLRASQHLGNGFTIGGSHTTPADSMRRIDRGTFHVGPLACWFVGNLHSRQWEYRKILGVTEYSDAVLIAVSNRQRMSGIKFHPDVPVLGSLRVARSISP